MLNKFFKELLIRPLEFIVIVLYILYWLSIFLATVLLIPHITDMYSWFSLVFDAGSTDWDINFFLKFLVKLFFFLVMLWIVFLIVGIVSALLAVILFPAYPNLNPSEYFNNLPPFPSPPPVYDIKLQVGEWVSSFYLIISVIFWIALIVLFFTMFTKYWKNISDRFLEFID